MTELRIWPVESGPTSFNSSAAQKSLSTEFSLAATASGSWWLSEIRVWRGTWDQTGPYFCQLYSVTSPSVGVAVSGGAVKIRPRGLGWQTGRLATPVLLTPGQTYRAVCWTPSGASSTPNYW